jgi:shikimate dehydrogenase
MTRLYGLIGFPLVHSFSKEYFNQKFLIEKLSDCRYENFPIANISSFPELIRLNPLLCGLNVTIPYKETVIAYLNELSPEAVSIGAVNCIRISSGKTTGYNTDYIGFLRSLKKFLRPHQLKALILGTGGSSRAVLFALNQLGIDTILVSRVKKNNCLTYAELNKEIIQQRLLIVNTTPLGMFPSTNYCPDLPYDALTANHLLFDLIYNPCETLFMQKGKKYGATVVNGLEMLQIQADECWKRWNSF